MEYYEMETEELLQRAETAYEVGDKEELDFLIELLFQRIDLEDWTENEDLSWPERFLEILD